MTSRTKGEGSILGFEEEEHRNRIETLANGRVRDRLIESTVRRFERYVCDMIGR